MKIYKPDNFGEFFMLPDPTAKLLVGVRRFECSKVYLGQGSCSQIAIVKEPSHKTISGYKAFHKNWTCRGKQYRVGETFTEDVKIPIPCENGMHFCPSLIDIFYYYNFNFGVTKIAEVEATGDVTTTDGEKFCTNELKIVREVEPDRIFDEIRTVIYWNLYEKLPTNVLSETLRKLEHVDDRVYDEWRALHDK